MKRVIALAAWSMLTACSPSEPPPATSAPKRPPPPAPATAPTVPTPPKPPDPPARVEAPRPKPPEPPPATTAPPAPKVPWPQATIHLPAFTFRAMDHQKVRVLINGAEFSTTPCLWAVTDGMPFDPAIGVAQWPPEGARYVGATQHREHSSWKAEVYLAEAGTLTARLPHLQPEESVVYVRAEIDGRLHQGALRLSLAGYRYIDYTPLVNPEGEEASRLLRSVWFEKVRSE